MLTPYALGLRVQVDVPTFKAYHAMLKDVPAILALSGMEALAKSGLRFMPTAPEIRVAAEKARRQQLALHPWDGCVECEAQKGWRSITDGRGDTRVERCPCRKRHQESLAGRGLLEAISSLPGEAEKDSEQVFPTVQQLPADVRKQLENVSSQKVLR